MKFDDLIDRMVQQVNLSPREPLYEYEISPSVRVGEAADEIYGMWDWQIKKSADVNWVGELQAALPAAFPPSFRSLITRYIFPSFEFGAVKFFGNTPEAKDEHWELRTGIFIDKYLSRYLLDHGFIQFARPATGNYDAMCFDTNGQMADGEYPIVQIDHEEILCHDRIRVVNKLAPSFHEFIAVYIEA